ncbi:hypothetical protein Asppvi_000139 [Aspergillus pseudoviridinutans]|uniref:Ankyrin repeat-containing domain protein n=1 Tax=Aspergillus pseudoviridinutans TaxID=1517512 RepID=A0A9P3EQI3_9EURO|nr:uncharacterized protein Asppvi_000139 [Aspergillus pseudoviridinutans]GIJ81640.1 hypothetical protein Asppvi_000139 [Aspergillus pseudoviridinutans]
MDPPKRSFHHENYRIAWLCALPVEMAAAEAMLDERHPDLPTKPNDNNTYILGRIHAHNVVIACLPSGVYGTTSAATLAAEIRFTFGAIQFGLMVGVGGGVWGDVDVRLGDVVVSKPTREFGGVIQYDCGKAIEGGCWERTGMLNKPPTVLLTAISRLQAAHMLRPSQVSDIVSQTLTKNPTMVGTFGYPAEREDTSCQPKSNRYIGREGASDNSTEQSPTMSPKGCAVHYGLIASGNKVIKDGKLRDKLAREHGILCFEMEAAGLMDNFPCLVIRGISDYADSHKTKKWQGYASLTAAAYTKELLGVIHTQQVVESPMITSAGESHTDRAPFHRKLRSYMDWVVRSEPSFNETLLERITSYDHEKVHQRVSRKRLVGTTQWFMNHPDFQAWFSGKEYPCLWCSGKIGSGKSIIASAVIEEARLRSSKLNSPTIFFYCDEQRASEQGLLILSSFIKQLCEYLIRTSQPFPEKIKKILHRYFGREREAPDIEDSQDILSQLFYAVPNTTYIVDGLDALDQTDAKYLLSCLRSLFFNSSQPLMGSQILFFSRDHLAGNMDIAMFMPDICRISTSENVVHDIRVYIEESIADKMVYKRLTEDNTLLSEMKHTLLKESSGMFLWVYLQLEILWDTCVTDTEIRSALRALPKDLEETYHRCVGRINFQDPRVLRALSWVRFAARPLHIEELREAVAFNLCDMSWDQGKIPRGDFVISCCANLLVLDPMDSCVRFAHSSVNQYLDNHRRMIVPGFPQSPEQGDRDCGDFCVTYLSFTDFSLQLDKRADDTIQTVVPDLPLLAAEIPGSQFVRWLFQGHGQQYRFLDYAISNWAVQTKHIKVGGVVWDKFTRLALSFNESWSFHPWQTGGRSQLSHLHALLGWAVRERHRPLLRIALGFEDYIQDICNLPLVGEGVPALHLACKRADEDIVRELLAVCDVNKIDIKGCTPLHYAAAKGHTQVTCMLLNTRGIKVNALSSTLGTPLSLAARRGWGTVVSELIKHGAALESRNKGSQTPLILAAAAGHTAVVEFLIHRGADIRAQDIEGRTPISWAIKNRHLAVVRLLLDHDPTLRSSEGGTYPGLLSAIEEDQYEVVKMMVEKGINPNSKFDRESVNDPRTLLSWAAARGQEALVLLLISKGADIGMQDDIGWTPLARAAEFGQEAIIKLLINHGADVNFPYSDNYTPLQAAAECWNRAAAELLIENGADPTHRGFAGRGPLSSAARAGQESLMKLLIEKGAYLEEEDYRGRTPLILAAEKGHEAVVRILLDHGADFRASDIAGRTPLIIATHNGHLAIAELLAEYSANHEHQSRADRNTLLRTRARPSSLSEGGFISFAMTANVPYYGYKRRMFMAENIAEIPLFDVQKPALSRGWLFYLTTATLTPDGLIPIWADMKNVLLFAVALQPLTSLTYSSSKYATFRLSSERLMPGFLGMQMTAPIKLTVGPLKRQLTGQC